MSVDIKNYGDADKKLIKKLTAAGKFDASLDQKLNIEKVNVEVMVRWVNERLTELLGFEDDVVVNLVENMLTQTQDAFSGQVKRVDPKQLQIQLTGFLDRQAAPFVAELWKLLLDAQDAPHGIPRAFVERKKAELLKRQATRDGDKAAIRKAGRPRCRAGGGEDAAAALASERGSWYCVNEATGERRWDAPGAEAKVVVRHVLVKHAGSKRPSSHRTATIALSKADAAAELEALRAAVAAAEDRAGALAAAARDRSDCPSSAKDGQLKPFARGELDKSFEAAAFALEPGALSGVVDTPSGLHLILRLS
ncbi:RNA-binding protein [Aureococcus anophagefferens]|uniref:RNA-binding protein n=2 Tax=Aureococcus anophagefferens TaxID=44056 RepID=A0ABR1G766_AURAN